MAFEVIRSKILVRQLKKAVMEGDIFRLRELVAGGAKLNIRCNYRYCVFLDGKQLTLLHLAVLSRKTNVVKYLIAEGVPIDAIEPSRMCTPLHVAAHMGHDTDVKEIIEILLKSGANPKCVDKSDDTPADIARRMRHYEAATVLEAHVLPTSPSASTGSEDKKDTLASEWSAISTTRVSHSDPANEIGYKLTDIFDFKSRERIRILQNAATKQEVMESTHFDEISEKSVLQEAFNELIRLGGQPDKGALIDKLGKSARLAVPRAQNSGRA